MPVSTHSPSAIPADSWSDRRVIQMRLPVSAETPILTRSYRYHQNMEKKLDMHYALELGLVLQGRYCRYFQNQSMTFNPGQIWLHSIWEPHGYQVRATPCEVVVLLIWPDFLANMTWVEAPRFHWLAPFIAPPARRPQARPEHYDRFLAIGRQLVALETNANLQTKLWLHLHLLEILLMLMEHWPAPDPPALVGVDAYRKINRAIDLALQSRQFITAQQAARTCGLNRNRFSRLFRQSMGLRFPDFVLRHRLNGAVEQMLQTRDLIKTIASSWGFVDQSHFHRAFVRHYGCTPLAYRRRFLGQRT